MPAGRGEGYYPPMRISVIVVILTIIEGELRALLIHRSGEPYLGWWALPGGLLLPSESLADAAARKLLEETGVTDLYLEQLFTFDDLDGEAGSVAVANFALVDSRRVRLRAEPVWEPRWFAANGLPDLAFNNTKVVDYAITRLRNKLEYTNVAYSLMPETFTLSELQSVYESIFGRAFDKRNFRRRVISQGIIRPTGRTIARGAHRPAELYEFTSRQPMAL
ncbi:MAG: NUDIX domain-containing protein [Dehalococcoidia bacterium]|nr:NUDIX domain-containing protein [Dehalococcoidia bacterium]